MVTKSDNSGLGHELIFSFQILWSFALPWAKFAHLLLITNHFGLILLINLSNLGAI